MSFCVHIHFHFPWAYTWSGISGSYGNSLIFEAMIGCFPMCLHNFTFPPAKQESSNFSTFSPTFIIIYLFYHSHPSGCESVMYCGFDLLSIDLLTIIGHLCLLQKCLIISFAHLLTESSLLLNCKSSYVFQILAPYHIQ